MNQFQQDAAAIVRALLEDDDGTSLSQQKTPLVPICAQCETEHGEVNIPREHKTHGLCRRHLLSFYQRQLGYSLEHPTLVSIQQRPENSFPADLAKQSPPPQQIESEAPGIIHVCGWCAKDFGQPIIHPGEKRTDGICRRHAKEMYLSYGDTEAAQQVDQQPDTAFAPDMAHETF